MKYIDFLSFCGLNQIAGFIPPNIVILRPALSRVLSKQPLGLLYPLSNIANKTIEMPIVLPGMLAFHCQPNNGDPDGN